ncbi:hypothetical protein BGW39_003521, partial [Mortierella sp. 14UC]
MTATGIAFPHQGRNSCPVDKTPRQQTLPALDNVRIERFEGLGSQQGHEVGDIWHHTIRDRRGDANGRRYTGLRIRTLNSCRQLC